MLKTLVCLVLVLTVNTTALAQTRTGSGGAEIQIYEGELRRTIIEQPLPTPRTVTVSNGTAKKLTVRIQELPTNPDRREYTVLGEQTLNSPLSILYRPLRVKDYDFVSLSSTLKLLATAVLKIPGVTQLTIDGQKVSIDRGQAFDWESLETQILDTLLLSLTSDDRPQRYPQPRKPKLINNGLGSLAVNREISTTKIELLIASFDEDYKLQVLSAIGPTGREIVQALLRIPAINWVSIEPYSLRIFLQPGQAWTPKLNRQVEEIIRAHIK